MSSEDEKLRLVKEVEKRPALWHPILGGSTRERVKLWIEIEKILGIDANTCKEIWTVLRAQFRNEVLRHIPRRIAQAKQEGSYDPNKKYYVWHMYDALIFLENWKDQDDQEKIANSDCGSDSSQIENYTVVNTAKCENDSEFIDNDCFGSNSVAKKSKYETDSSEKTVLLIDSVVKVEPELQIDTAKQPLENEEFSENSTAALGVVKDELNDLEEFVNYERKDHHNPSTSADLNDEDYVFLSSFLSQTKTMTPAQKLEFRVNMQKLLADTFPACASIIVLEKQLQLPDDDDPDRKFLISFWPFIKSMSLSQNLQFRIKMPLLLLKIVSPETNQHP